MIYLLLSVELEPIREGLRKTIARQSLILKQYYQRFIIIGVLKSTCHDINQSEVLLQGQRCSGGVNAVSRDCVLGVGIKSFVFVFHSSPNTVLLFVTAIGLLQNARGGQIQINLVIDSFSDFKFYFSLCVS